MNDLLPYSFKAFERSFGNRFQSRGSVRPGGGTVQEQADDGEHEEYRNGRPPFMYHGAAHDHTGAAY